MNVLDENIPANQRQLLEGRHIRVRQIGLNIGKRGMQDGDIISLLLKHRRATFFTRDADFHDRTRCHPRCCLAYLAVDKNEVAAIIRRLLRHSACNTQGKRLGKVIRASLAVWRLHDSIEGFFEWA